MSLELTGERRACCKREVFHSFAASMPALFGRKDRASVRARNIVQLWPVLSNRARSPFISSAAQVLPEQGDKKKRR
jgi:hypothetical protein